MPRKQPTEDIDYLGKVDAEPLTTIGEYFASRNSNGNFMKPPNFDSPGDSLESIYILAKLEKESLTKHLNVLEENRRLQKKISFQRIQKTSRDQAELRSHFVTVNTFLRDIAEKKKIAYRKISTEVQQQQELNTEIESKTKKINDLKIFQKELKSAADEYKLYETVLGDAAKKLDLPSIRPLINRCDAIMIAQGEITQMNNEQIEAIEAMRKRIVEILKQAELIYGGLKNELAEMSRAYNKAQNESLRWEKVLLEANRAIVSKNLEKGLVRDGINQIYRTLCKWRNIDPKFVRKDVELSLDYIQNEVEVLTEVLEEYHNPKL